jgi:hypothetical protein
VDATDAAEEETTTSNFARALVRGIVASIIAMPSFGWIPKLSYIPSLSSRRSQVADKTQDRLKKIFFMQNCKTQNELRSWTVALNIYHHGRL